MSCREVEVGKNAGFCGGVNLCVKKLEELTDKYNDLYCLGDIVHNPDVIKHFKDKGLKIVESIDDAVGDKLVIRAHGASKEIYDIAEKRNIKIFDLTCPKVLHIRKIVKDYINDDTFIVLIAQKNHPEAIGTISFCGSNSIIVENESELNEFIDYIKSKNEIKNIVLISQTTFNERVFLDFCDIVKNNVNKDFDIIVKNTICNATSVRQKEVEMLAKNKECMIIIGGKKSSNTKKLYDISLKYCNNTILIESVNELDFKEIKQYSNIGVTAGASTPNNIIEDVVNKINVIDK